MNVSVEIQVLNNSISNAEIIARAINECADPTVAAQVVSYSDKVVVKLTTNKG